MQFAFAGYVLDPDRRELTRGSAVIAVGPQVFDLLAYLLRNREHVVSKDDLIDAVWGGRIVSDSTLTSHINAVRKAIGDTGEEQHLVRTIARKGYRFVGEVRELDGLLRPIRSGRPESSSQSAAEAAAYAAAPTLALPDRPSIAVLPFLNLSGDRSNDYFVDGVVEDIIFAMSRMNGIFVIARNSSFRYKDRAVDVKQVGRELGVRYVVEGSLRMAANRVRIIGQLVDATSAANLWSERFEGTIDNIFEIQDQLTASVVGAIAPHLQRAEIERAKHKPTDNLDAYDYYLRATAHFHFGTKEALEEALRLLRQAFALDPEYAAAYGMAAWCYVWRKVNGWMADRTLEIAEGTRLARRAIEIGHNDAIALTRGGHALVNLADEHESGVALVDRAKVLNPNLVSAWFLGGFIRIGLGRLDEAVEHMEQAIRLSPLDPEIYRTQGGLALAHLLSGRREEAAFWAAKAYHGQPHYLLVVCVIAVCHVLADEMAEAERAMKRIRELNPDLRVSNLRAWIPLRRPQDIAVLADGLRKAGLPE